MNYAQIRRLDVSNGPGVRTTLFVSGCTHGCPGCFNREQQDFKYGQQWTGLTETTFIKYATHPQVAGVSILGGEPLQQLADDSLYKLLVRVKAEVRKPIWLWTGYTWEEIIKHPSMLRIITLVDVVVDGKYSSEERVLKLKFRGSANQRIIDVYKSLEGGRIYELGV